MGKECTSVHSGMRTLVHAGRLSGNNSAMLSPDSTFPLIVLMTCVELFTFITARPTNIPQGKKGLQMLYQDMRTLLKLVSQERHGNEMKDFEQSLTSLPSLNYKTEDLKSLEVSSTLGQLYTGLKSFKFHLDWIQQKQEEMGSDYYKTKKLAHRIQVISHMVLIQIGTTPSELVYPSLSPLNTAWNLYKANVEILDKLYFFCNWYIRALGVLKHRQQ
ncbi:interleukin-11-like [Sinocyclocheilus rhinocerous]|uniref:interleukin-11-like n=1 Tax=Sinocyclocheilus rhinocerous TaxID=307959 RepID=UPI0007B93E92|nr:PREDICTED: interleukin-11-like [Sinocyclocheilus rhinocerous]